MSTLVFIFGKQRAESKKHNSPIEDFEGIERSKRRKARRKQEEAKVEKN
jgi:hypothetical protein